MKRYLAIICCVAMMACAAGAFADTTTTAANNEYKDMTELKAKLIRMKKEMDSFMKEIVSTYSDVAISPLGEAEQDIKVDVTENDKEFIVKADMPGMSKDRIEVVLENERILRISGMREAMMKKEAPGMVRQERSFGKIERTLELPGEGSAKSMTANYKEGVLEITIPRKKAKEETKVKIRVQ